MSDRHAILVIGLGYGDCGKGSIVDFLARRHAAHTVVRFNGGPQAGHNVITSNGRHHTFSQFGSATFLPRVRTVLSRFMLVEPYALLNEAAHLSDIGAGDALERLIIDARCPIVTPAHQIANRLRERARGAQPHGTCGLGIGEAMQDLLERPELMLHARELGDRERVAAKLKAICEYKRIEFGSALEDVSWIDAAVENYATVAHSAHIAGEREIQAVLAAPGTTIYEGAQGVLLDQEFGFHPHTTWSCTTFANAESLLQEIEFDGSATRIGVLRTDSTRHGVGPMVSRDDVLRDALSEPHNAETGWQGRFRVGVFDAVAARYALRACGGVDGLALTHVDRLPLLPPRICSEYRLDGAAAEIPFHPSPSLADMEQVTAMLRKCRAVYSDIPMDASRFVERIERALGTHVAITSAGPTAADKRIFP